ncbi:MAG: hypothetical protein D8M59_05990 [Planctomycetes bacterium]|nr:hypothetical protein [Planctomycetota bacterium]
MTTSGQKKRRLTMYLAMLVAVAGLQACTGGQASSGFVLRPGMEGSVFVNGSAPFVQVRNQGPAEVQVVFEQRDEPAITRRLIQGSVGRTVTDGTLVTVRNLDATLSCTVTVYVQRYTGLNIDMPSQIEQGTDEVQ